MNRAEEDTIIKNRAHALAERGWYVFPSQAKKPLVRWGTEATLDHSLIDDWWGKWPTADICIATGAKSGLVVIDWDRHKSAHPNLAQFPLTPYPDTYEVSTPKGGSHFYFIHPGYPVQNSVGRLHPQVDVRGDGGMVVAYPACRDRDLSDLPGHWDVRRREYVPHDVTPAASAYAGEGDGLTLAVDMLQHFAQRVLSASEGRLNVTLYQLSADAYKMVAAGELDEGAVTRLMRLVAVQAGHPDDSAVKTILSARNKGFQEPTSCVTLARRSYE